MRLEVAKNQKGDIAKRQSLTLKSSIGTLLIPHVSNTLDFCAAVQTVGGFSLASVDVLLSDR